MEKMRREELYDFSDPETDASMKHAKKACARLQTMTIYDDDYREVIEDLIPGIPRSSAVCPPFHCDHGHGIRLGEGVFVNYGCVMLDSPTANSTRPNIPPTMWRDARRRRRPIPSPSATTAGWGAAWWCAPG